MRTGQRVALEEINGAPPPDTTRMSVEMIEAIRRQNDKRIKEFMRVQEEVRLRM